MPVRFLLRYDTQLSDSANFLSFYSSLLMLFRCMTGEGWNDVMADLGMDAYGSGFLLWEVAITGGGELYVI